MAFKSKAALGGAIDPNINSKGRIKSDRELTGRELRQRELIGLVRKLKPHLALSISEVVRILGNAESADSNKLKAASMLIQSYQSLVKDIYTEDDDTSVEEIQQQNGPVFSLTMIRPEKDIIDVEAK